MINEIVMPQMGADMKEGTILRWLKAEGEEVKRGEIIAEIETDKANIEIEAFGGGVFRKVLASEGETKPVGAVIGVIAGANDDISKYANGGGASAPPASAAPADAPAPAAAAPAAAPEAAAAPPPTQAAAAPAPTAVADAPARPDGRLRASPVARRIAEEKGVDLQTVRGSGPDGRILRRDVESATPGAAPSAATPGAALLGPRQDVISVPDMSRLRQTIARRMQQSKQESPHYYLSVDVDMTDAVRLRAEVNSALGETGRVSINDLIILAATRTLQKHPRFNSWWVDDRLELHSRVNIGIAVALDDGLVAPAVLDCDAKTLTHIARDARDLAERARTGALQPDEYIAGTFTISNLGAYGVDGLVAIINPPQTGILGIGAVKERPVVREGQIVARSMMTVILSADHRATNGAEGALFLQTLREYLEKPSLMLV